MSAKREPKWWLWFDYETNGLWQSADEPPVLLEMVAVILPYGQLDIVHGKTLINVPFSCPESTLQAMDSYVVDMHTKSGLLTDVRDSHWTPEMAEKSILADLRDLDIGPGEVSLGGSGIAPFDVPLMRLYQFELYKFVHYAPYDIGAGRRMLTALWPETDINAPAPEATAHRALVDVQDHLAEAKYYRENYELVKKT